MWFKYGWALCPQIKLVLHKNSKNLPTFNHITCTAQTCSSGKSLSRTLLFWGRWTPGRSATSSIILTLPERWRISTKIWLHRTTCSHHHKIASQYNYKVGKKGEYSLYKKSCTEKRRVSSVMPHRVKNQARTYCTHSVGEYMSADLLPCEPIGNTQGLLTEESLSTCSRLKFKY